MYYNHNLRSNLQEWKSRLYKATPEQFGHQVKYCLNNLDSNIIVSNLLKEAILEYPFTFEELQEIANYEYGPLEISFNNDVHHASYCYQLTKHYINEDKTYKLHLLEAFINTNFNTSKNNTIEELFTPIFYYLHDRLDKSSSVIYLLEKYKKRTEWFTRQSLFEQYTACENNYEQIFEDDLRLFLFDQGIDYPFSTPKSTSGRGDIIGAIDTNDPIIIEIKLFDMHRSYNKNRILEGFSQIVKYTNDFNKNVGYLVVFNLNDVRINFILNKKSDFFPPMINFNGRTFFIIVVDIFKGKTASKIGKTSSLDIYETELTTSIN